LAFLGTDLFVFPESNNRKSTKIQHIFFNSIARVNQSFIRTTGINGRLLLDNIGKID
jgi:ferric iron reductase protein FhuF